MGYFVDKKILIISPEPWGHISVSKHHYAMALAKNKNSVYFLNPPAKENKTTTDKGVTIVDYKTIRGINKLPGVLQDLLNRRLIERIKKLCQAEFDVVWSFDAFRFQNLHLVKTPLRIYHAVDVHIAPLEWKLASSANLILSVSEKIRERFTSFGKMSLKINHGLASYFFEETVETHNTNALIKEEQTLKVGYVGNLDNWCIDKETLLQIVKDNSAIHFYFIGPHRSNSALALELRKFNNSILLGRVPSEQLPTIFSQLDLFLMCYKGSEKDVNSNHHKILEFISTGKPSVINYTDEYNAHRDIVIMADDNIELPQLFKRVIENMYDYTTVGLQERRKIFALTNSYQNHLEQIDKATLQLLSETAT